jgi:hypothetical protein
MDCVGKAGTIVSGSSTCLILCSFLPIEKKQMRSFWMTDVLFFLLLPLNHSDMLYADLRPRSKVSTLVVHFEPRKVRSSMLSLAASMESFDQSDPVLNDEEYSCTPMMLEFLRTPWRRSFKPSRPFWTALGKQAS